MVYKCCVIYEYQCKYLSQIQALICENLIGQPLPYTIRPFHDCVIKAMPFKYCAAVRATTGPMSYYLYFNQ